jgi:hypothetical protein
LNIEYTAGKNIKGKNLILPPEPLEGSRGEIKY